MEMLLVGLFAGAASMAAALIPALRQRRIPIQTLLAEK